VSRSTLAKLIAAERNWINPAWLCVLAGLLLSIIGIYAIDLGERTIAPASAADLAPVATKQLIFLFVGLLAAALLALPHERVIRFIAWPAMGLSIALLIFLLIPAVPAWIVTPRNGVRGWIDLGPIDLQPGEFAKIAFVLAAADYLRFRRTHREFLGLLPPALIAGVPIALIFLQPDLGTAMLFVPSVFAMLLVAGARLKHLAIVVLAATLAAPLSYPFLKPYQQQRILGLIAQVRGDQHARDDMNYQAFTAQMLIGAGGTTGTPDAKSRAIIRFARLPERHNDMIFAVVVNRFGLLGGLAVAALYALWLAGALLSAALSKDPFGRLTIVGLAAFIATQAAVNIGMNLGVLPIVGLTLPFISYGGSSMLVVWIMTGLTLSIALQPPPRMARPSFEFRD